MVSLRVAKSGSEVPCAQTDNVQENGMSQEEQMKIWGRFHAIPKLPKGVSCGCFNAYPIELGGVSTIVRDPQKTGTKVL